MSMFNTGDILETIEMFTQENLDVRTVTMGISLLDHGHQPAGLHRPRPRPGL